MPPVSPAAARHNWLDDAQAYATAILFVALGLALLAQARLLTGGVAGIAFLVSYAGGLPLGWALFLVNLPFYALAWRAMGARFTLRTLAVVTTLSLAVEAMRHAFALQWVHPLFAAIAGGLLIGVGLLVLFRHRASLGGIGVLALHLQRRRGWSAGAVQLAIDTTIVGAAFAVVDPPRVAYSVLGALVLNLVLVCNHRPGRYAAS